MGISEGTKKARAEAYCRGCANYMQCDTRHIPRGSVKAVKCQDCGAQSIPTMASPGRCMICGSDNVQGFIHPIQGGVVSCDGYREAEL